MPDQTASPGLSFQPVSGLADVERARQFLLAQGWAGLPAGAHLLRLVDQGVDPAGVIWWVPGRAGEPRALALLHQGLLGFLLTSNDEGPAARTMLENNLARLQQVHVPAGQVDCSSLEAFDSYHRDIAVAPSVRPPAAALPPTREGVMEDAEQIHRVYQHVSWMRRESPEEWRERIAQQRSWVAELQGQVVAVARWTMAFGGWVEVGGVATHPDSRRKGAGAAVTLAATSAALAEGRQVALRYGDPALAALYHPLGFEHVGRELVFYRRS
ncbi:MAG: GNAT family N-acetyltransferase [Candidatus Dormiibacterota bacterium]